MDAGSLRNRITILAANYTENAGGEQVADFETAHAEDVPAEIRPVSSKERLANAQISEVVSHRIHIRYLAGITSDMRIQFGDRIFSIDSVIDPDERRIELWLLCFEQKPIGATA